MSAGEKIPWEDVEPWARIICKRLIRGIERRACDDGEVVGSVARMEPLVGDVEIVLLPRYDERPVNVLGERIDDAQRSCSELELTIQRMIDDGILTRGNAWGPKLRRLIPRAFSHVHGFSLEIHLADHDNYGNMVAIWTGPAEWSKALVSRNRAEGGVMPFGLCHRDGYLHVRRPDNTPGARIPCRTEPAFFRAIRVPWTPARERTASSIIAINQKLQERSGRPTAQTGQKS
jgi:hypothetical protein